MLKTLNYTKPFQWAEQLQVDSTHMGELSSLWICSVDWLCPSGLSSVASQAGFTPATSDLAHPASKLENCDKAKHLNH